MEGHRRGDEVVVGGDARQRLYDARGYGRPLSGNDIALAPVEAAHLLFRGDLDVVDGEGFPAFLGRMGAGDASARFLVYADLRERGFYLSPAREGWVDDPGGADLVVYPRGSGPRDGEVRYRVRAVGERTPIAAADLGGVVLAVADEEGEVTYLETDRPAMEGGSAFEPPPSEGTLLADRVVVWEPPDGLYGRGFYGQPLAGRGDDGGGALGLSLVEAAYLAGRGALRVDGDLTERGRSVEGDRFDRRLAAYAALRDRGLVPKTGFKFGADFRVYPEVESVDELGHSAYLVWTLPPAHEFTPRELALDVRLAGGVRKRAIFALVDGTGVDWLSVARLTP